MNSAFGLLLAFGIGVVTELRSMTAPAVLAWAAHMGWISRPTTPARTGAVGLTARVVMGLLTGARLGLAGGVSLWLGALIGAIGAIAGAFGGYLARVRLVRALHVPDIAIAIPEDLVAIGLGLLLVFQISKNFAD